MNTESGAKKISQTVKEKYGEDFYRKIGAMGGRASRGGFATMDKAKVIEIGRKGGQRRWKKQEKR